MSSGIAYPPPTYIPPLSVFNPTFFPQSFGTTSSSGGGGGQSNIFPNGLTSGNTISLNGGTGGQGGTGVERTITGISYLDFVDSNSTNPTAITGFITLNGNTLEIGSANNSSGINVNLQGTTLSANGVAIANGGNVSNNINNTFQSPATTQNFDTQSVLIDNSVLSFPNNGYIQWGNGTSLLNFPNGLPTTGSGSSGLALDWNQQPSNGEVDMICYGQGGQGGFAFYAMTLTTAPTLIANLFPNGIDFKQNIVSNNTFTGNNYFNTGFINLTNLTGTFPSTPLGYSQFVSYNGNPWFSPTNGGGVQITTSTSLTTALLPYALLASPTFTGTPTAPTATAGNSSTQIATTAFVATSFAPLASPTFTGIPLAPTATIGDNSTQLATTAFVQSAISGGSNFITANWTAQLNGINTEWYGWIPSSVTATTFSFYFYSNTPANTSNLGSGETIVPDNSQLCGYGIAYRQNYMNVGTVQYGYVFTILSYIGLSTPSPNLTIYSVAIYPPSPNLGCCYCYLKNANDNGYFYTTPNNGLTLLISQAQ